MTPSAHEKQIPDTSFDVARVRADFPIFQQKMNGKPVVFLDTAASAQKPQCVIDAFSNVFENYYANVHRGVYAFSQETTRRFENARETVARFVGAQTNEIVFTRNATEAINLVAACWGSVNLQQGDEILITALEHHANIVPWQMIAEKTGAKLVVAPITADGEVRVTDVLAHMNARTKIMAISHMSNALGTIVPVAELVAEAQKRNVVTLIDGCQAILHGHVDMRTLGCDFYVFSGHKIYGPTGIGVLYGRENLLNAMPPYQGGGDMIDTVTFEKTTYRNAPARFEAGTPAIAEAIALATALDYVSDIGIEAIARHEADIYAYALQQIADLPGLTLHGRAPRKASILSFTVDWAHPSDVATILDKEGIAVRVGHHCAMPLMGLLGVTATIRASLGMYNTHDDIDALVAGLMKAHRFFA